MSEATNKLMRIGNNSFIYSFTRMDGGEVDITVDPTFVLEYLRSNMPELFNQSNETVADIKELIKDSPDTLSLLSGAEDTADWKIIQSITARTVCGLPYPSFAPNIRLFWSMLKDAMCSPSDASYAEVFACLVTCFNKISEAEQLKKNSLKPQSSLQPIPESQSPSLNLTIQPFKVCGSISKASEPEKTSVV